MTRYARGKPTHQRVPKESTAWEELKSSPAKSKKSQKAKKLKGHTAIVVEEAEAKQKSHKRKIHLTNSPVKEKQHKVLPFEANIVSEKLVSAIPNLNNETNIFTGSADGQSKPSVREGKKYKNSNVKGFGDSKVVKIFGQFWVPGSDAKRLQKLVADLKQKGLSRKEISDSLQNERRRAEKSAKRIRDKTCFNCRQYGHVLSDCPKNNQKNFSAGESLDDDMGGASGGDICFKCGSTEHTSRKCKKRDDKFDFAKCFICSKTGHISRQCPDNKRGIYPSGGSCNECGQCTHLVRDCPKLSSNFTELGHRQPKSSSDADLPSTSRLLNPYASTEYEQDAGNMTNFTLIGKFAQKNNRKIKF